MSDTAAGPLDGLLVADFSRILAGPYATMLLADLGAEVVKVEGHAATTPAPGPHRSTTASRRTTSGSTATSGPSSSTSPTSPMPPWPVSWPAAPTSSSRTSAPAGWRSTASTTTPSPRRTRRVCVDQRVRQRRGGPTLPGYDLIVQAISGLMSLTGPADGEPYRAGISVFDVMAGLHATIGLLAALHRRHETGRGQHVEVNLLSSALSGMVNHTSAYVAAGVVPYRMGNSHPSLFPYEAASLLRRRAHRHGRQRPAVPQAGRCARCAELADDPRFAKNPDRTARRHELRPSSSNGCRPGPGWSGSATHRRRVPCGPINTVDQGVAFAEDIGLDPVVDVGPDGASVDLSATPSTLSETPPAYRLPPPTLDEHGAEIRRWLSEEVSP